jgi:hypothetical protein
MRTLNSLLAPSLLIIVAGIAFSFYSVTYYPHYDYDRKVLPYPIQDFFVLHPVVIYPERAFGVSLIVAGSIFVALILTTQTALSHFNRHRSQAIRRTIPQGTCWFSVMICEEGQKKFAVLWWTSSIGFLQFACFRKRLHSHRREFGGSQND